MKMVWELVDKGIQKIGDLLPEERLDKFLTGFDSAGNWAVPFAMVALIISGGIQSFKDSSAGPFGISMGLCFASVLLGYLSHRFGEGCQTAGQSERSVLSLRVYTDLVVISGIIGAVVGVFAFLGLTILANFQAGALALVGAFVALLMAWHMCHPEILGADIDPKAGAGSDLVSLLAISLRLGLRVAGPLVIVVVMAASLELIISSIAYASFTPPKDASKWMQDYNPYQNPIQSLRGMLIIGIAMPMVIYLNYVFSAFTLAFVENALSLKTIARNTAGLAGGGAASLPAPTGAPAAAPVAAQPAASAAPAAPPAPAAPRAPAPPPRPRPRPRRPAPRRPTPPEGGDKE